MAVSLCRLAVTHGCLFMQAGCDTWLFPSAGWVARASQTLGFLIQQLPDDLELQNDLGVTYLMSGRNEKARQVFKQVSLNY